MNHYQWEELSVGMTESFERIVTEAMLQAFFEITGDENPLHREKSFAQEKGYPDRVVYGLLTTSFLSTLAGVYLPGERSLIHSVEVKLVKPVQIGDTLTVSGEITELDERFHIIKCKAVITNQNQEKVLRGNMQIGVL